MSLPLTLIGYSFVTILMRLCAEQINGFADLSLNVGRNINDTVITHVPLNFFDGYFDS